VLSVNDSAELRAAVLAVKAANRTLRSDINRETVRVGNTIWRPAIAANLRTPADAAVLNKGVRVKGGNPPMAIAANSRRKIGKAGPTVAEAWPWFEFGANRNKITTYKRRSPKGNVHNVTRHTARQLPARAKSGRVVYPAFADVAPRMASLWVQMIVAKYNEAFEGKRG
jgi:hypothetical protein